MKKLGASFLRINVENVKQVSKNNISEHKLKFEKLFTFLKNMIN